MRSLLIIIVFFLSFSTLASNGQIPPEQKLALNYIHALTNNDMKKLSTFYSRESIFQDKTADKKYVGRSHILEFIHRAHEGLIEYKFTVEHMFNSGSLVVIVGSYSYKGLGRLFGKPGKVINISVSGVTTLDVDVKNHRIKKHVDMIDYQTMNDQLEVQ
ncbi:hypothetical protein SOPP22_16485 [Shewanella sp. OPT22]|uniref:nuclear transport factor 2 family protein n=1 Tax=Parashewanella hymeniacidonis TaxID=2807618 RepID=UPI001020612B|nr:nuclear transport factor 2 family protein [Parashewanella hymeniacidonis]MBM7072602.1 ester cyclase [Parashewanella hymeniacidonis]RYV01152.1 hypothetical protein SOPP22_16485 [Shewanella sp. OPT22]